ncbi:hypothetical protein PFISCL1PPCAC_26992, partial [Pristionchus fissidentatus]
AESWRSSSRRRLIRLMVERDEHIDRAMHILDHLKRTTTKGTIRERATAILVCACIEIMTALGAICMDIRTKLIENTAEEQNTRERLQAVE